MHYSIRLFSFQFGFGFRYFNRWKITSVWCAWSFSVVGIWCERLWSCILHVWGIWKFLHPFVEGHGFLARSDIIIVSEDSNLYLHKCILSVQFNKFLTRIQDGNSVLSGPIKVDIKPRIIWVLMYFIYSGVLNYSSINELVEICEIAKSFSLLFLRKLCSRILKENLTLENAT